MRIAKSTGKTYKYLNPLIASNILYLNWLAEQRKEEKKQLGKYQKVRNNGKK